MLQGARNPTGRQASKGGEAPLFAGGLQRSLCSGQPPQRTGDAPKRRRGACRLLGIQEEREGSGEGPGSLTQLTRLDRRCEKGSTWKAKTYD